MSLMKNVVVAVFALSASSAVAGDAGHQGLVGAWQPLTADARYTDGTVLVFSGVGRFAALVVPDPESATATSTAGDDGALAAPLSTRTLSRKTAAGFVVPDRLDAASGSWIVGEDGGEVVLAFDNQPPSAMPGTTRYLQMLLLGDELHPYPGMEDRSPIAATSWRRVDDAAAGGSDERASR